jgi:SAM-dependent methyltransferase
MAKKSRGAPRPRRIHPHLVREGLLQRVRERTSASGTIKLPAVPALLEEYVALCARAFTAAGRPFTTDELAAARALLATRLAEAFGGSQRSKIAINFHADPARPLGYEVLAEISTIADAYTRWVGTSEAPLFGAHADARVLALAETLARDAAILDFGAGTGRNALTLARRGHRVDAVEITPQFAEIMLTAAEREGLTVRVFSGDVLRDSSTLERDYRLFVASELVPDFRSTSELRSLFELSAEVLAEGGLFVFNLHLAVQGYTPDRSAREFAQQCYSALFTASEVNTAAAGLPFEFVSDDSVHDYEREHLPASAWPPTPWFVNWVSGRDVYDLDREKCPIELRWLVFRKSASGGAVSVPNQRRLRKLEPSELRQGLLRRLQQRTVTSGVLTLPALPALLDVYVEQSFAAFTAIGRDVSLEQRRMGRDAFEAVLREAFEASPRSNIVVTFEAAMGAELTYTATTDAVPLTAAYAEWLEAAAEPLFGEYPDAKVSSLIGGKLAPLAVLDIGAGLGRNALALARLGHRVDATEITPEFAAEIRARASAEGLAVRVLEGPADEITGELGRAYDLVLLCGVAGDFRGVGELRRVFELAAAVLPANGVLLLSAHLAREGYTPDAAAREWGQQCSAMFFTLDELTQALHDLPLELRSNESVYDFEADHLPEAAWPPTPAFGEWALALHMFALEAEQCPIELRWLVLERTPPS